MRNWIEWTPEEDALLEAMRAEGKGRHLIARALGRTANSVKNRIQRGPKTIKLTETISAPQYTPQRLGEWPDLPADAFKDQKVTADPQVTLPRPATRTLGGVAA